MEQNYNSELLNNSVVKNVFTVVKTYLITLSQKGTIDVIFQVELMLETNS